LSTITTAPDQPPSSGKPGSRSTNLLGIAIRGIGGQNLSLIVALILLVTVIGSQNSNLFLPQNLTTIGTSIAILGVIAVGQSVVMIIGGLDISVGSQAGVASVASAMIFTATGSAAIGILGALVIGAILGLFNSVVIIYGRVNAVIATLATFAAFRGIANLVSDGRSQGFTGGDPVFTYIANGTFLGIPVLIWVLVLVVVSVHILLRYTDIGRKLYAIGGNDVASRLSGINLNRYVIAVYVLMGVIAAIAGILLTARTGGGQPVSGSQGLELAAITAAALGGCALQGGKGTVFGTLLAVVLLGVLTNGLTILGINSFWQDIAQGALLIIAVMIQQKRLKQRAVGLPA
jgi:ribose transport system permease protein